MTPNCEHCNNGEHDRCEVDWCECRQRDHSESSTDGVRKEGQCTAALNIAGEHFWCDEDEDHYGLAHSSQKAEAIWSPIPYEPPVQKETERTIPVYAMLDLYMALGHADGDFDAEYRTRGYADTWAWLLQEVRDARDEVDALRRWQGARIRSDENATAVVLENGDPIYQRAKRTLDQIDYYDEVDVRTNIDDAVYSAAGNRVRGTLRIVLTVEGRVR